MAFWVITVLMALGACVLLALALLRGHELARPAAEFDLQVYRDQLAEVERDAARGILDTEDAARLRTEVSRRILAADKTLQSGLQRASSSSALRIGVIAGLGLLLMGGSLALYRDLGAPGYDDLALSERIAQAQITRETRPSQDSAEAALPVFEISPNTPQEYVELVEQLRSAVAKRPDDLQGAVLLATHEMRIGNAARAHAAQSQVLRIKGSEASSEDFALYADMLVIAAGGYVSPQAEAALAGALQKDPENGIARYYTGLMMMQVGRPDLAFRAWATLLQDSPDEAPWVTPIRAQIEDLAFRAGVKYDLPPLKTKPLAGPSSDDIENAAELDASERQEMIQGMVSQLSERLATQGGSPEEWAQLLRAMGVLGDEDRAGLIWQNAKEVFADHPEALAIVRDAARDLGVTQ